MIISGPPANSARVNCQPSRSAMIIPSSITRLVEAISKAIAAVKSAPLRNSDLARATAAYEQDDEAAPRPEAMASVRGRLSPSSRTIDSRRTTACTMADRPKPRIRAQRISQVIEPAIARACSAACQALIAQRRYGALAGEPASADGARCWPGARGVAAG